MAPQLHFSDQRIVYWIFHHSTELRESVSGRRLRPYEGLKYHGATERLHVRCVASHALNHAYESHIIGGIDPEPGAGSPAPEKSAFTGDVHSLRGVAKHSDIEAKTQAWPDALLSNSEFAGHELV